MSLQETLKQLRQRLGLWVEQQKQLRRRKLNVLRLEDRRLPDATFALVGNALTLDGFDGGSDSLNVSFDASQSQLSLSLNSGSWLDGTGGPMDPALNLAGSLLTVSVNALANGQLSLLQIDGGNLLKTVSDSGDSFSVSNLQISGEAAVVLDGGNDFDSVDIQSHTFTLCDSNDLQINSLQVSDSAGVFTDGTLTSTSGAQLSVANHFEVSGSSILLTETNDFGSLEFHSSGNVSVHESGGMLLTGSSSAGSLDLLTTNNLSDDIASELIVSAHAQFSAASVVITGSFEAGSLEFHAAGTVEIHEIDGMIVSETSDAGGSLILEAGDSLEVSNTIDVDGDATLRSGINGGKSDLLLNSELNASGDVLFEATGDIEINAAIDPATVTLHSNDDIHINAGVIATDHIIVEAGLDGSGSVDITSPGCLLVNNFADTSNISLSSGSTTGTVILSGTVSADALVTIQSNESVDGSGLINSNDLVIRAQSGIGANQAVHTAVGKLAFRNESLGDVQIHNAGALNISNLDSIDGSAGNALGNFGGGRTTISTASPITIASDVTSVGSMTLTAGESSDAPLFADDLTIISGVTASVSGAGNTLTLKAGDDVNIHGTASASAGNVAVMAGFGDVDGDGSIHFDGTISSGNHVELSAITGISDDFTGSIASNSLKLLGSGDAVLDNGHSVTQLAAGLAGSLTFHNGVTFEVASIGGTVGIRLPQAGDFLELQASGGTIKLSENITTLGKQTYLSAVELKSSVTISSGNGDIDFASTINSETGNFFGLTVNSSGQTSFEGAVGTAANQALGFLVTDASGTTELSSNITVAGELQFGDAITIVNNITLTGTDTDTDSEGIDFGATVDGAGNDLTITGGAGFAAAVSNIRNLTADHIDSESTINANTVSVTGTTDLGGDVTTTGHQIYSGAAQLTSDVRLTSSANQNVTFGSTLDGTHDLSIHTGGLTTFNGNVGTLSRLQTLTTDAVGQTVVNAPTIMADVVQFDDDVLLQRSTEIDATTSTSFGGSVQGTTGVEVLTVVSNTVTFNGLIANLADLRVDASGQSTFNGNVDVSGFIRTDAAGTTKLNAASFDASEVQFNDAIELCRDTRITADRISFAKTIDEATAATGSELTLAINNPVAPTGDITLSGKIGATRRLEAITITSANDVAFQDTITTVGSVIQQAGTGLTTFHGTGTNGIGGSLTVTTDRVSFNTADMTSVGAISIVAANQILLNAAAGLNSGTSTISLSANQDGVGSEGFVQHDGSRIQTTNSTLNAIRIEVGGTGTAAVNDLRATGTVSIDAGGSIIDNSTAESANVMSSGLALKAHSGIGGAGAADLNTTVANLEAVTDSGGIGILESDDVTIGGADGTLTGLKVLSSGDIVLTANGSITVTEAVSGPDQIQLTALGATSDLTIASTSSVSSTDGDISLNADRTVTVSANVGTSLGGNISIAGNNGVGARNVIVDNGAIVSVQHGNLTVDADSGRQSSGDFSGILLNGASLQSMGDGDIILSGRGGDAASGHQDGVEIRNFGAVRSLSNANSAGTVTIIGFGGSSSGDSNSGIEMSSNGVISSTAGDISLSGTGGNGAGNLNHGISIDAATITATGASSTTVADVHLTGTRGSGTNSDAILLSNSSRLIVQNSSFPNGAALTLDSALGDVTETTGATVTADSLQALGPGDFSLTQGNDVTTLAGNIRGTFDLTDIDSLLIGTAGATSGLRTGQHDARLTVQSGALTIGDAVGAAGTDDINLGTADLTLAVSGVISQSSGSSITANGLELLGIGSTILEDSGNSISTLAADYNGSIRLANSQALTVGSLSSTFASTAGIATTNDDVTLCATSIDFAEDVIIGTGTLRLQATTGSVTQAAGALLAGDLGVRAATGITLNSSGNDVNTFAADAGSGSIVFVDADGFTIGTVTANGCFTPDVVGIKTGADFEACVATGSIQLNAGLNVSGTVRLEATTGDVTSTVAGQIVASNLAVRAAGNIDLDSATNQISTIFAAASTSSGVIQFADANGFTVGSIAAGNCVHAIDGVTTANGNVRLTTDNGTLTNQTRIIAGSGTADIAVTGTGNVELNGITTATATGHVLVATSNGNINVNGAVGTQSGNIGLEAIGATSDITANANIVSGTGNVIIVADRDVTQNDSGDIRTSQANVLIDAGHNWSMTSDAEVVSTAGSVGGITHTGEIALGKITADHVALQSAQSIYDANGTQINAAAKTLSMVAKESIGDQSNPGTTPSLNADAIDTSVETLAALSAHGLFINESDSLIVDTITRQTIGGMSFGTVAGLSSRNSDILLNVGESLTLNQSVNAGTADLRIIANGNVNQSASGTIIADEFGLQRRSTKSGDVTLFAGNDVNVIAATNLFDGGNLTFADSDDLTIRTVSSQTVGQIVFNPTTGLQATGGDIHVQAQRDLTIVRSITSMNGVLDSTSASGESIVLESVDGNILIDATAGAISISTDEGPGSHAVTGDNVTLLADSNHSYSGDLDGDNIVDSIDTDMDGDGVLNNVDSIVTGTTEGKVTMLGDVTVASDGGVAKKFGPRPAVGESATAFFIYTSNPLPVVLDNSPAFWSAANAYVDAFGIEIGTVGEENLTVDVDWRDPVNESRIMSDPGLQQLRQNLGIDNPVSSDRYQQFLIANGGLTNEIGHIYTANDMTLFQKVLHVTTIVIDLSVSHHASLNITGAFVEQAGTGQSVPGLNVTSSDNPRNGFGNFDNGIATFKIPTVTPAPAALFSGETTVRLDRPVAVAPPENSAAFTSLVISEFGGGAVSGTAFSTEVYFQIRRQFEADGPAEIVVERITDGRLISSREAFEKFVQDNPELQDGAGYEIWLISETGGQKVERPVVEFEITGGQPGPANDMQQESYETPKLIDLPFEQPEAAPAEPQNTDPAETSSIELDPTKLPQNEQNQQPVEGEDFVTSADVDHQLNLVQQTATAVGGDAHAHASPVSETGHLSNGIVDSVTMVSGTVFGLAINRFRTRQSSESEPPRYSRAARFGNRHRDS